MMSFFALVTLIATIAEKMTTVTQKELETMERPAQDSVPLTVQKRNSNVLFQMTL